MSRKIIENKKTPFPFVPFVVKKLNHGEHRETEKEDKLVVLT
jgi:hypothetical protein